MKNSHMQFSFSTITKDTGSHARTGIIHTPHGNIQTPAFSPVATRASVRALSVDDLKKAGAQVVLANTYHLYLQPGVNVIEQFGGFGPFMNWHGPTITDSGGYQVSFLWEPKTKNGLISKKLAHSVKITDQGAEFRSHIDGSTHVITPETSMQIQHALGADIIMAFDQPLRSENVKEKREKLRKFNVEAFERTLDWEERSYRRWKQLEEDRKQGAFQALFGIIHGGADSDMVQRSSELIRELDFPGMAIGGEFIGSDPIQTSVALETANEFRDFDKPLHALGLGGGPEGIFTAVERGIDLFDNTSVTRMARAGLLFIYPEDGGNVHNKFRVNLRNAKFADSEKPIAKNCSCYACSNFSCAYLNHLFKSKEFLGFTLASIHNIQYVNNVMRLIREAIDAGDFQSLKNGWIS